MKSSTKDVSWWSSVIIYGILRCGDFISIGKASEPEDDAQDWKYSTVF